ncbi:hypothetical protein [Nonomuraea africana]|uniref:Nucleotidyl transferase AbiEii/AbiGii toxin family protein n=1 Tax=Nonomuraea africana TaxID=46171 RepID=A0ABR9KWE4_9ACTN|nr:hypothetical protein [Nonomuraea africana]MBE1566328.1 hypothetical protein [Nonomuraea africana]
MSLFPPFQARLVEATEDVRIRHGLLLAGGYALRAHGLAGRPSHDLVFATAAQTPMPEIAADVAAALDAFAVSVREVGERMALLVVTDEAGGQRCGFELLREALRNRPVWLAGCQVVGQDDAVGLKVRALHGRGLPKDFVDVAGFAGLYSFRELERLGAAHEEQWGLAELVHRLESVDLLADEAFQVDEDRLHDIRRFAYAWVEEIKLRRADDGDAERDDPDVPAVD